MLERRQIENQTAEAIAQQLTAAFDRYCAKATVEGQTHVARRTNR